MYRLSISLRWIQMLSNIIIGFLYRNYNKTYKPWWCWYSECRGRRELLHLYVCRFECRNSKKYVTQLQNILQHVFSVTYFFEFPSIKIMCNVFFIFLNRLSMLWLCVWHVPVFYQHHHEFMFKKYLFLKKYVNFN